MKQPGRILFICLIMLLVSGMLHAQDVLLITSETLDKQAKATVNKVYLKKDRVLIETGDTQKPMAALYDAEKQEIYLIDHKKKEYYLLNKAEMEALSAKISEATKLMEQSLKQMPEEQRKVMEEQMRKMQENQEPLIYKKVATDVPVKQWKSSRYDGKSKDKLKHEIYVASYKELGEDKESFKALTSLLALMQSHLKQMSKNMPAIGAFSLENMPGGEEGLPVKSIYYDEEGNPESTSLMTSIEEISLAEEKWQIPPKYKQKKLSGEK